MTVKGIFCICVSMLLSFHLIICIHAKSILKHINRNSSYFVSHLKKKELVEFTQRQNINLYPYILFI